MIQADGFSTETLKHPYREVDRGFEQEAYIVFDYDGGAMYSWDRFVILASMVDGRLFTIEGSGCSCNNLYTDVYSLDGPSGLGEPVSKTEALAQVKEWEEEGESWQERGGAHASATQAMFRWERQTGL